MQPRMRVFAGPNGSGKSTLNTVLPPDLLGYYLNPDALEIQLQTEGVNFTALGLSIDPLVLQRFLASSPLLKLHGLDLSGSCDISNNILRIKSEPLSYVASALADYIRQEWLKLRVTFTFESVMSSKDKIETMKHAREAGYRVYLYFICTQDPLINVNRVRSRVELGGHPVPEEKILSRYDRSLRNLSEAILASDRAYLFDNSAEGAEKTLIAQIDAGNVLTFKSDHSPDWVEEFVLSKMRQ